MHFYNNLYHIGHIKINGSKLHSTIYFHLHIILVVLCLTKISWHHSSHHDDHRVITLFTVHK